MMQGTRMEGNPELTQQTVAGVNQINLPTSRRALVLPGLLLGIGLGGFVDGIVLHQLLQWHHMLTSHGQYPATAVAGLEVNTLWDGIFHAGTWVASVVGVWRLWGAGRRGDVTWSGRTLIGLMAMGWGLFNLIEGVINHHLLGIHHVRYTGADARPWDLGFLFCGVVLFSGGWWLARRSGAGTW